MVAKISMREINRDRAIELFDGDILKLYILIKGRKMFKIAIKEMEAKRYIAKTMHKAGLSHRQISLSTASTEAEVVVLLKRENTLGFKKAIELIPNPLTLLNKSSEYGFEYTLSSKMIERVVLETLAKAGFSANQIAKGTGLNYRTIQRARKSIKEDNERQAN